MSCIKKWEATIWLPAGTKLPTTVSRPPTGVVRKIFKAMYSFVEPRLLSVTADDSHGFVCGNAGDVVGYDDEENHAELVALVRSVVPEAHVETCWLNVEDQEWDATFDTADDEEDEKKESTHAVP